MTAAASVPPSHEESRARFAERLTGLTGVAIDAADVLADLDALERAYPDLDRYELALDAVLRQLEQLLERPVGRPMQHRFSGWWRCAFQSRPLAGMHADLRIVYRRDDRGLRVLGFGHRRFPRDLYLRMGTRPGQPS